MAETDILNPVQGWWPELGDNPNWSYGWIRKTASNKKIVQPRLGRRYSREVMNSGYSATLNFIDRPYSTVLRLKQFFEQFQSGYFTLIDYDGGGRHHVGNFTTEPQEVQTANDKYTIQGIVFEECAQARMLQYPSLFDTSGHKIFVVDDYLDPRIAVSAPSGISWVPTLVPTMGGTSLNSPSSYEMFAAVATAGVFAQVEYVGWGFRMCFRTSPLLGLCSIYVDGVLLLNNLDLSNVAPTPVAMTNGQTTHILNGNSVTVTYLEMPLDKHRIKVVATGAGHTGNSGAIFPMVEVMH